VINYTPFIKRVQKNFELEQLKKVGEFTQGSPPAYENIFANPLLTVTPLECLTIF
jgi:hypothetical protein